MVAYNKETPKDIYFYQSQRYHAYEPSKNIRNIGSQTPNLDEILLPAENNSAYHREIEVQDSKRQYELLQPIWFDEIMRRLSADARKQEKQIDSQYYLNLYGNNVN
jgi:hypothetical protein